MNAARYTVALFVLITLPPGLLLWLVVHPLAPFWRTLGAGRTYAILFLPGVALATAIFLNRGSLLAIEFGTRSSLIVLAAVSLAGATTIALKRAKHLRFDILAGIPELSKRHPGRLLTAGIYAKIRHPRYLEAFLLILALALFANHLATYALTLLALPVGYLIIVLEERELAQRFGEEYEAYRRRVPRFVPRTRRRP